MRDVVTCVGRKADTWPVSHHLEVVRIESTEVDLAPDCAFDEHSNPGRPNSRVTIHNLKALTLVQLRVGATYIRNPLV